jgi:hypothetical protein
VNGWSLPEPVFRADLPNGDFRSFMNCLPYVIRGNLENSPLAAINHRLLHKINVKLLLDIQGHTADCSLPTFTGG